MKTPKPTLYAHAPAGLPGMAGTLYVNSFHNSHVVMQTMFGGGAKAVSKEFGTKAEALAALEAIASIKAGAKAQMTGLDPTPAATAAKAFAERKWSAPLTARKAQQPPAGLFGDDALQPELFAAPAAAKPGGKS